MKPFFYSRAAEGFGLHCLLNTGNVTLSVRRHQGVQIRNRSGRVAQYFWQPWSRRAKQPALYDSLSGSSVCFAKAELELKETEIRGRLNDTGHELLQPRAGRLIKPRY